MLSTSFLFLNLFVWSSNGFSIPSSSIKHEFRRSVVPCLRKKTQVLPSHCAAFPHSNALIVMNSFRPEEMGEIFAPSPKRRKTQQRGYQRRGNKQRGYQDRDPFKATRQIGQQRGYQPEEMAEIFAPNPKQRKLSQRGNKQRDPFQATRQKGQQRERGYQPQEMAQIFAPSSKQRKFQQRGNKERDPFKATRQMGQQRGYRPQEMAEIFAPNSKQRGNQRRGNRQIGLFAPNSKQRGNQQRGNRQIGYQDRDPFKATRQIEQPIGYQAGGYQAEEMAKIYAPSSKQRKPQQRRNNQRRFQQRDPLKETRQIGQQSGYRPEEMAEIFAPSPQQRKTQQRGYQQRGYQLQRDPLRETRQIGQQNIGYRPEEMAEIFASGSQQRGTQQRGTQQIGTQQGAYQQERRYDERQKQEYLDPEMPWLEKKREQFLASSRDPFAILRTSIWALLFLGGAVGLITSFQAGGNAVENVTVNSFVVGVMAIALAYEKKLADKNADITRKEIETQWLKGGSDYYVKQKQDMYN